MCDKYPTRPIHLRLDHLTHINMNSILHSLCLLSISSGLLGPELITEITLYTDI